MHDFAYATWLSGPCTFLERKMRIIGVGGKAHMNIGALTGAQSTGRRGTSAAWKLVAGFAAFALVVGIGYIGGWSQATLPQAQAAALTRGQPTTQGVTPNWQLILNYDAVWPNGPLVENATYWTADVNPPSRTTDPAAYIVGMQTWADDMNTFTTAPVLGVLRVATKSGTGSTTTSLNWNNWQSTAVTRIGGTMNGGGGKPLTIYFWDNAGGYSQGGLNCGTSQGYPAGYTPIIRVTSETPDMYYACMPIANSTGSMGGFNADGTSPIRLGNSGAYGGEADQYTGNIYVSSAYSLDARVDSENQNSRAANDRGTWMFTVWNPETGMYTLSGSVQPGDWTDTMSTVPQERVALLRDVDGSNNFSTAYASADFVMDSDGNIYLYVAESGTMPSSNTGGWNAKILRVEPARDPATGNIIQGTASNPWRYYVTNKVLKDPAYPGVRWSSPTSLYGNAFVNGQMLLTASSNVSGVTMPSTASAGDNGTTSMIKIDPLTSLARPVWSTDNLAPLIKGSGLGTHDSASPQGAQVISGHLYNDADADGVLPIDENGAITAPGLYNQQVGLYDSSFTLLAVHTTDSSGRYDFIVSGKEDSTYYIRPIQVQIPVPGGTMVNAAQTWALGSQEDGTNSAGVTVTNTVAVQCYNAGGGQFTTDAHGAGAACFGALNPASADPGAGEIGSTGDPATWLTYATAHLRTAEQVPTADFGFTVQGSYGDSVAGPTATAVPAHINTDPATSVWLGDTPGSYTGAVTDNSHTTDDGVRIRSYDGSMIPLQDTIVAATGSYTLVGDLSGGGRDNAHVTGWVSGADTTGWNAGSAWRPDVTGETASGTFQFQESGAVSGSPTVQFRAQVSTATITAPENTSGQYYSTDAVTGGANWTTPGEIEDYTFHVADAVYRPAVKTTGGSATFTIDGQPLTGNSAAFTLGRATVVNAGITKTIMADAPDSTWELVGATVKRISDGQDLEAVVTKVDDTRTEMSWPTALGDDVRVELVYSKAADPGRSELTIDPDTTIVGGSLTATATTRDADGNLLGGKVVNFTNLSDAVAVNPASCTTDQTTGSCSVSVTSHVAGTYTDEISATLGTGSSAAGITGSPKTVTFTPGKPDPNRSSLAVTPAIPLEVGTAAENTFTATTLVEDSFGNAVPLAEVRYTVTNVDGTEVSSATRLSADHCETGDKGACDVTLTSTKSGTYLIYATVQDPDDPTAWTAVQDSPAIVVYVPKEVCVEEKGCTPQPGVTNVTHVEVTRDNALNDGQATDEITAYTYDEWGNEVSAEVQISTTDAALKLAGTGSIVTDAMTGQGTLTVTSLVGGPHTATASIDDTNLSEEHGSPLTLHFTDQPATTGDSTLELSSTSQVVGTIVTATVTARNANDTPVSGQEIRFAWDGPANATWTGGVARCTTDPEGICSVSFTDTKPETLSIHARLGSDTADIKDSPQSTTFTVGTADLTMSEISASPTTVAANGTDASTVTVTSKDQYGNQLPHPGDTVTVSSTLGTTAPVVNNDDGTYTTTLTSQQSGQATLGFTVNDHPATGEKSWTTVTFTTTAFSVTNSSWTVVATTTATAADGLDPRYPIANANSTGGDYWTAVLTAEDSSGNPMVDLDTTKISFSTTGLATVSISEVVNNTDGTYSVTIASKMKGDAIASVTYDGAKVGVPAGADTPTEQTLTFQAGRICVPSTTVTCSEDPTKQTRAEVDPNGARADGTDTDGIKVYAFDKDGNPVEATFSLLSLDQAVLASTSVTTDPQTGQGSTTATSTSPSPQRVQVLIDGALLPGLPQGMLTLLYTVGDASETNSTLDVAPASQTVGQNVTATVTARDGAGLVLAGIPITVRVGGSATMIVNGAEVVSHDCVTNTSGICQVTITDQQAEEVVVTATIQKNGSPVGISGSPATVTFIDMTPPPTPVVSSTKSSWAVTPTTTATSGTAPVANDNSTGADYWTGVLTVRDQNNAPMDSLDVSTIVFTPTTANVHVSSVTNTGGGTYTVYLTSTKAGNPTVSVTVGGGAKIGATPGQDTPTDLAIPFQAGPPEAGHSTLELDRTSQETGKDVTATVTARDANDNTVANTTIVISVNQAATVGADEAKTHSCRTGTEGVCEVTLTDTVPEQVTVRATLDDAGTAVDILGSPQTVTFVVVETPISYDNSTWTLTPTTTAASGTAPVANGNSTGGDYWTGVLTARDQNNRPMTNLDVSTIHFAADPAADMRISSVQNTGDGTYTVTFTSTTAGNPTASVTYDTAPTKFGPETDPTIAFQAGPLCIPTAGVSCPNTYAEVNPNGALADGRETDGIVVHAGDKDGNPVVATFRLASADGQVNLAQSDVTTAARSGTASTTATSTVAGNHAVTVTVNGTALPELTLVFGNTQPSATTSTLDVDPTTQAVGQSVTATVTARDADNHTVANASVVVSVDGSATVGPQSQKTFTCQTNAVGVCAVTVTDQVVEQVTIHATVNVGGTAVDIVGSPATVTFADVTAPDAPSVTSPKPGAQINDPTPDVVGKAEPGATVTVRDKDTGTTLCTATADTAGNYRCTSEWELGDGPHTLSVTATDSSGNTSAATEVPIRVDTIPPQPPAIDRANGTEISGRAEPGSIITVTVPGVTDPVLTTADQNGSWLVPTPVGARDGTVRATASDPVGNTSPETTAPLDVTPPAGPTIDRANGSEISGMAEPGSTVKVRVPGVTDPVTTIVNPDGHWSISTPAGAQDGTVRATATDPAGNISPETTAPLDVTAPEPPVVNPTPARISGTAEAGSTVTITVPGVAAPVITTADGTGNWSIPTPAGARNGIVSATATDQAGNVSQPGTGVLDRVGSAVPAPVINVANATKVAGNPGSTTSGMTITVTFPDGQVATTVAIGDGSWSTPTPATMRSGDVTATATDPMTRVVSPPATAHLDADVPDAPSIDTANATKVSGTAEPGSTVTVTFPDGTVLTTTAGAGNGAYSVTTPQGMPTGGKVTVTATDQAGNVSAPAVRDLDTLAPDIPVIDRADAIEISGTAEPGSTVTVRVPGVNTPITIVVGGDGKWRIDTPAGATDGTVRATATDPAGNVSGEATRQIDVTAPSKPVVNPSNGTEVTGKADPGSVISITDGDGNNVACKNADGTTSASVTVDQDGKFSCIPDKVLEPGSSITVVAKDTSGLDSDSVTVKIGAVTVEVAYAERHRMDPQVVTGHRFNRGEQVCLVVHSDPVDLGCQAADDEGEVTFIFDVPEDFDLGVHTVTLSGRGSALSASTSFTVVETVSVKTGGTVRHPGTALDRILSMVVTGGAVVLGIRH